MTDGSEFEVAGKSMAASLADRPVLLRIDDPDNRLGALPAVLLQRQGRMPAILQRSLLMGRKGKGVFIGWMPVGLSAVRLAADPQGAKIGRRPRFRLRRLSRAELFLRCAAQSPRTVLRALRLLAAGNRKGFEFRLFRLCNSLTAPAYRDWFAARQPDASPPAVHSSACPDFLWLALPPHIVLAPDAITHLFQPFLDDPELAAAYCDEDMIDRRGRHRAPLFRLGWNPPLARSGWLRLEAAIFRRTALPDDFETLSVTELLLAAGAAGKIAHVPRVLMHRTTPRPAPPPPAALPRPQTPPPISVVIPTRDRAELLSACLDGLLERTRHDGLDILVIDNDSREAATLALLSRHEAAGHIRRIAMPGQFNFAQACNLGVAAARHELVLLLNNDIEPLAPDWLAHLTATLDDPAVGAAGALLLFPDGSIQHGGVTLGGDTVARHSFHFLHARDSEDDGLLSQTRHVSAVTAACLLTRRSLWREVGGMNARDLAVAFNDVDYCLKLREAGKTIVWTPQATLLHRESMSRGADDTAEKQARFAREERYMHERWGDILLNDPYHNPNLSLTGEDFALEARPRSLAARVPR